ncbi:MAG: copper resistance CopC family protein [Actinomycetota bacterium]
MGTMVVMRRGTRFGATAAGAALTLAMFLPSPAAAHAAYDGSNPPDKGTVSAPPSEVWAEFTEPPADGSTLQIIDPCGERVDAGDYRYLAYRLTVSMSSDKAGRYSAHWRVISDLDSHPTSGTFTFTSTGGEPCPGEPDEKSGGGGGGGSGSSGGSSGSSGNSDPATGDEGSPDAAGEAAVSEKTAGGNGTEKNEGSRTGKGKSKNKKNRSKNTGAKGASQDETEITLLAGESAQGPEEPVEEMPLGWLLASFGIAGLIGAAGGVVYVGIVRR